MEFSLTTVLVIAVVVWYASAAHTREATLANYYAQKGITLTPPGAAVLPQGASVGLGGVTVSYSAGSN